MPKPTFCLSFSELLRCNSDFLSTWLDLWLVNCSTNWRMFSGFFFVITTVIDCCGRIAVWGAVQLSVIAFLQIQMTCQSDRRGHNGIVFYARKLLWNENDDSWVDKLLKPSLTTWLMIWGVTWVMTWPVTWVMCWRVTWLVTCSWCGWWLE